MTPGDVADALHRKPCAYVQEFIRTGSLGLDLALGGGWPVGHISELSGPPDSGKSALAYYAIANVQKNPDAVAGFVDAHGTFNPEYAVRVGVDLGRLYVVRALASMPFLLRFCELVIVDPLLQVAYPSLLEGTTILYTTELRRDLGSMSIGNRVARTGALHETSARVILSATLREGVQTTTFKVEDASFTRPYDEPITARFDILDSGIHHAAEVLDWAAVLDVIEKKGSWYRFPTYGNEVIHGRNAAAAWLRAHPAVLMYLESQVRILGARSNL